MSFFDEIEFKFTDDNSVGLYSKKTEDIFHSKTGALKESYDKFINPCSNLIKSSDKLNILDICYGIGYNTKAILHKYPEKQFYIDALEYSRDFVKLSPFIFDAINDDELKSFILAQINPKIGEIVSLIGDIDSKCNLQFFSAFLSEFKAYLLSEWYINNPPGSERAFLHNIYYSYISNNCKYPFKASKYGKSKISFFYGDARSSLKELNNTYDIVFLDAFSPQKDPTLWTIDFLHLVKNKMKENSILVSYSKSNPFRSALVELGFNVGKTFIDNVDMGTVASFNKENIINHLTGYDIELLNTRCGITYKDKYLNKSPEDIFSDRTNESTNSDRISHTAFLKSKNTS